MRLAHHKKAHDDGAWVESSLAFDKKQNNKSLIA